MKKYKARATDMAFKEFESIATGFYTKETSLQPTLFDKSITSMKKSFKLITDYNFNLFSLKRCTCTDYFENKLMYTLYTHHEWQHLQSLW
jgi:hypothetical protein